MGIIQDPNFAETCFLAVTKNFALPKIILAICRIMVKGVKFPNNLCIVYACILLHLNGNLLIRNVI